MSMNMHLGEEHGPRKTRTVFLLWQTPTHVTCKAMKSGADPKQVYFEWVDWLVEKSKPKVDSRLKGPALEGRMKAQDYQSYLDYKAQAEEHKRQVEQYLAEHPAAAWRTI